MTNTCDSVSFPIAVVITVLSSLVWLWWKPAWDDAVKLFLKIAFAAMLFIHVYVAWVSPEIFERLGDWYTYLPRYEWIVTLVPILLTWAVLDALGHYLAAFAATAIIFVVTKHMYLGASLGIALGVGVVLHFAMRSHKVRHLASIMTVSLLCSALVAYGVSALAVRGCVSSAYCLHPLPPVNATLLAHTPQRGTNCTEHLVNMFVVCDSNCPVISDIPHQAYLATNTLAIAACLAAVRVFGILCLRGQRKDKREDGDPPSTDEEDQPLCFRARRCWTCCASCQKRSNQQQEQRQQSVVGGGYERVQHHPTFDDVSG